MTPGKDGVIAQFRLYPGSRRGLYVRAKVFDSLASYVAYAHRARGGQRARMRGSRGAFFPFRAVKVRRGKPTAVRKIAGEMLLIRGWLSINVISHECCHAAHATVPRAVLRSKDERAIEEYRCRTVGWLTNGLYAALIEARLAGV